ncbi:serine hydrolase [Erysipelothrix urinaevulpis]|uniref:serine hydrolase domain-containing protein n=1 Tax=Erysipelothrix urinaevulpis TaxID=2683717 RepID=UPI00135AFEB2|nr:serine hydrolase domain-containing protein [Erysipelothrix urinaevulpis]
MTSFENELSEIIHSKSVLGLVACTMNDDKIHTYSKGTTNGEIATNIETRYDLASITKLFVTTRIFQLMDENRLSLDTVVQTIIPEFKHHSMTISELLLHTSGLLPSARTRYELSNQALIDYIFSMNDYVDQQRGQTVYSCLNFIILGKIIERLDQSLDQSIKENILDPLNMSSTSFNGHNAAPTEILNNGSTIQGRVHDQTAFALGGIAGNAGLFSTLEDMSRFAKGLLSDDRIMSFETKKLIMETNIGQRSYGWNRFNDDVLFHTGSTGPLFHIDFKHNQAFILLTNRTYPDRENPLFLRQRENLFTLYLDTKKGA